MNIINSKAVISKEEYKKKYKNRSEFFSADELNHLKNRTVSTGAGFIALKSALKKLLSETDECSVNIKDIELDHNEDGAPVIKSLPQKMNPEDYKVSVSHTKEEAIGLAAGEKRA